MTRCEEYGRYEVQRKMRGYERREDNVKITEDVKSMKDVRTTKDVKTMRTMKTMTSQRMEAVMDTTECSDE
jgi:hypothetical protein